MIDTVLLQIHKQDIPAVLPAFRSYTTNDGDGRLTEFWNPDKLFIQRFGYSPNITVKREQNRDTNTWEVKRCIIQFSSPKLLYGTNYYGVDESDYDTTVAKLVDSCRFVGFPIDKADIELATLKRVDFCFNFILPDVFPYPVEFLKKLTPLDAGKTMAKSKHRQYLEEQEGFSVGIYNGSVGMSLYDKYAQLKNQEKTREEMSLLAAIDEGKASDKILRFEVRWQNQKTVQQHLYTYLRGEKNQPRHLTDVFDNALAQQTLMTMFEKLTGTVDLQTLNLPLVPIEDTVELCKTAGIALYDTLAIIGRAYVMQSLGENSFKKLQDLYYSRQTRSTTERRFDRVLNSTFLPTSELEKILSTCKHQLKGFQIMKPSI